MELLEIPKSNLWNTTNEISKNKALTCLIQVEITYNYNTSEQINFAKTETYTLKLFIYLVACAIMLLIELACSFAVSTNESYNDDIAITIWSAKLKS